jgi:hypothetical protein
VKPLPPPNSIGNPQPAVGVQSEEAARKKKSLFGKFVGVFKGDNGSQKPNDKSSAAPSKQ